MKKDTSCLCVLVSIIAVACLVVSTSVYGQFTRSVAADQIPNNGPNYYGHERNVARTTDGTLVVAWQNNSSGGQISSSSYDEVFQTWSTPVDVSFAGDEADLVGLIADSQNRIHAVWHQHAVSSDPFSIYHAIYTAGSWSTPNQVSQDPSLSAEEPAIEIDSNGRIVIVWNTDAESDGAEWILCSFSSDDGANWTIPDTLSSSDGIINGTSITSARVALWAGSDGRIVATWHEDYGIREREIHVNQYDGSNWSGEVVISDTTAAVARNWHPNVAMDSQDNIYVVYADDQGGSDPRHILMAKKSWAGQWTATWDTLWTETAQDFNIQGITIDMNDNLYAGFRRAIPGDTTGLDEVVYMTSIDLGNTWAGPITLSRPGYDAGYITFVGHVTGDGVDVVWRESADPGENDQDTTAIVHAKIDFVTAIDERGDGSIPFTFDLLQNYPNPFNPTTTITYSVRNAGDYELAIYNLLGEKIRTVVASHLPAGEYVAEWDGKNDTGVSVASGVYFYRLSGNNLTLTKKMILMR